MSQQYMCIRKLSQCLSASRSFSALMPSKETLFDSAATAAAAVE